MTLITLFSTPKPFIDPHISKIQRNAIQSWIQLGPDVEVLIIGEEAGIEEVAAEYGVAYIKEVDRNELGTPLVSSIFAKARQVSTNPLLSYVNADILLLADFLEATRQVHVLLKQFVMVAQRWDLRVMSPLDFSSGWEQRLRTDIIARGRLHFPAGSDFFTFPRELFNEIPNFAIGRAGWDNWMIYYAIQNHWTVVDTTPSLTIVHQDHDYSHLPDGKPHYNHEESQQNMVLAGGANRMYTILDSNKQLVDGKIHPPRFDLLRLARKIETGLMSGDIQRSGPRWAIARLFRRWRRKQTGSLK
jgi:hypothetical protein